MRHFITKWGVVALAIAVLGLAGCGLSESGAFGGSNFQPENVTAAPAESSPVEISQPKKTEAPSPPASSDPLPSSLNLDVPFYSQAPRGDWGIPYQEACEEASLLLASYYALGEEPTLAEFENDLLSMVDWEVSYFGQYEHTSIDQTAEMARVYLGMTGGESQKSEDRRQGGASRSQELEGEQKKGKGRVEIIENPSADDLRTILARGGVIVAPFAGRYLGNPYFTDLGPVYHMLVIRGYEGKYRRDGTWEGRFITNDVGTRHGKNYKYSEEVLMTALHDWHESAAWDPEGILKGVKKVLVVGR